MSDESVRQILELCVAKLELLANNVQGKEIPEVRSKKNFFFIQGF